MPRRLGLETLETRDLFAGNITATQNDGSLLLVGDPAPNVLTITQIGPSRFHLQGSSGTTINGQASLNVTLTKTANIQLRGGDDRLQIGSATKDTTFRGAVNISTGAGADTLTFTRVHGTGGTTVMGLPSENDADTLNVRRSRFTGNITLQTGGGDDRLNLFRAQALGTLRVNTGSGNDHATVDSSTVNNVFLLCGSGNDTAFFSGHNRITGNLTADGGPGQDTAAASANATFDIDLTKNLDAKNFERDGDLPF